MCGYVQHRIEIFVPCRRKRIFRSGAHEPEISFQAFPVQTPVRRRRSRRERRLIGLAVGASCVMMLWMSMAFIAAFLSGNLGAALARSRVAPRGFAPTGRVCRSFAETPELKGAPTLKAPVRPVLEEDAAAAATVEVSTVWKAPDKADEAKRAEIELKAQAEREKIERAEAARRLRDARREIRDFANSLGELYGDELGQARLPAGVVTASKEPNNEETKIGFNPVAELINSRAAMIGFFLVLIIEVCD
eukprot:1302452-Amorphochlora_amoeboformis.AAC.1